MLEARSHLLILSSKSYNRKIALSDQLFLPIIMSGLDWHKVLYNILKITEEIYNQYCN